MSSGVEPAMEQDSVHVCAVIATRNDAVSLPRLAESLTGVIDQWLVVDFGSTDDTVAVAARAFGHVPGQVIQRPFVDPIRNGNEVLKLAGGLPEPSHLLIVQPDMVVEAAPTFRQALASQAAQRLSVVVRRPLFEARQPLLVRTGPSWFYDGWGYQRLASEAPVASADFDALRVLHHMDRSERASELNEEVKAILAVLGDSGEGDDDPNITLQLAMNFRELGRTDEAVDAFARCMASSSSPDLTFYCAYQIGEMHHRAGRHAEAAWSYLEATQVDPERPEAFHRLGRLLNEQARWEPARVWLEHAVALPPPQHGMFPESWVTAWGITFELAIAMWWTGGRESADAMFATLLERNDLPPAFRRACEQNLALSDSST